MTEIKIHPAAECVRLMDPEELASLAESIEAHGLRDPIILGRVNGEETAQLVDGRNRLRACEMANVTPRFETLEFESDDAVKAYVEDKSEHRNINKGQKAMRLAWLYPDSQRGKKVTDELLRKLETLAKTRHAGEQRLSQARTVYHHSRELAIAVREGTTSLDDAYATVKREREARESDEGKLTRLRTEAPDIAELVDEGRQPLNEAFAAYEQRKREAAALEQNRRETIYRSAESAFRNITAWGNDEFVADVYARLDDSEFRDELIKRVRIDPQYTPDIKRGAAALTKLLQKLGG